MPVEIQDTHNIQKEFCAMSKKLMNGIKEIHELTKAFQLEADAQQSVEDVKNLTSVKCTV